MHGIWLSESVPKCSINCLPLFINVSSNESSTDKNNSFKSSSSSISSSPSSMNFDDGAFAINFFSFWWLCGTMFTSNNSLR